METCERQWRASCSCNCRGLARLLPQVRPGRESFSLGSLLGPPPDTIHIYRQLPVCLFLLSGQSGSALDLTWSLLSGWPTSPRCKTAAPPWTWPRCGRWWNGSSLAAAAAAVGAGSGGGEKNAFEAVAAAGPFPRLRQLSSDSTKCLWGLQASHRCTALVSPAARRGQRKDGCLSRRAKQAAGRWPCFGPGSSAKSLSRFKGLDPRPSSSAIWPPSTRLPSSLGATSRGTWTW
mmetsp:Transcript_50791/g.102066  ORF Transcript_50791/g.102066 Transcript_50791/m.102066 type:complete len:233 (+) Transcript_50791:190-888(+)